MKKVAALILGVCCLLSVPFAAAGQLAVPYYNQASSDNGCWLLCSTAKQEWEL